MGDKKTVLKESFSQSFTYEIAAEFIRISEDYFAPFLVIAGVTVKVNEFDVGQRLAPTSF